MKTQLMLLTLQFLTPFLCMAQQQVAKEIMALQNQGAAFQKVELLKYESADLSRNEGFSVLRKGTLLKLNSQAITNLIYFLSVLSGDKWYQSRFIKI